MFRRPTIPFLVRFTLLFIGGIVLSHFYGFPGLNLCLFTAIIWLISARYGLYAFVMLTGWLHGSLFIDNTSLPVTSDLLISSSIDGPKDTYKGQIQAIRKEGEWTKVRRTVYFRVQEPLPSGDLIIFAPNIRFPENPTYLFANLLDEQVVYADTAMFQSLRWQLHRRLSNLVDTQVKGVAFAMLFGTKEFLSDQRYQLFKETGGAHVLAVSGLHVGLIYGLLIFLLRPMGNRKPMRIVRQVLLLSALWMFAGITGFSPSVVRAVGFFSIFTLAGWRNTMSGVTHALFLLLLVVGCIQPDLLHSAGLQLSYVAVLSITMFQPTAERRIKHFTFVYRVVCRAISVSLFAQLGTLPLVGYYFGGFSLVGVITSLVYIPYTFLVICFSILLIIGGSLLQGFNTPLLFLDSSVMSSMQGLMQWDLAYVETNFSLSTVILLYMGLVLLYVCLRFPSKYLWLIFLFYVSLSLVRF